MILVCYSSSHFFFTPKEINTFSLANYTLNNNTNNTKYVFIANYTLNNNTNNTKYVFINAQYKNTKYVFTLNNNTNNTKYFSSDSRFVIVCCFVSRRP